MEKEPIKVLSIVGHDYDAEKGTARYIFEIKGTLKNVPVDKAIKIIEKAINKVKPLDIPTL